MLTTISNSNDREERKIIGTYTLDRDSKVQQDLPYHEETVTKEPTFIVTKSHNDQTIHLELQSPSLRQKLPVCPESLGTDSLFQDVVESYMMIKQRARACIADTEIHLFFHDFLSWPQIYEGIDWQQIVLGPGGAELERDIHAKRIEMGLDNLDFLFLLGQAHESSNHHYLSTFWRVFNRLIEAGDIEGLRRVCEPLVTTGKIEWRHSDQLFKRVLKIGNLEVFRYILGLASRTQSSGTPSSDHNECTFHPLYVAIRLGHVEAIEQLICMGEKFDGFCIIESSGSQKSRHLFNPLTAAAYWDQPHAIRLLLQYGMANEYTFQIALNIARSCGHKLVLHELQKSNNLPRGSGGYEYNATSTNTQTIPILNECSERPSKEFAAKLAWGSSLLEPLADATASLALCPEKTSIFNDSGLCYRTTPAIDDSRGQEFGFRLSSMLKNMCLQVQSHTHRLGRQDLAENFRSFGQVWERGLNVIRQIAQNRPPISLVNVLDCLLVTSAVTKSKEGLKNRAYQR